MRLNKEKKLLGGPMFNIEENERLRKEKLRGGYFKENSSESSQNNSDPNSPDRSQSQNVQHILPLPCFEEKKLNQKDFNLSRSNPRGGKKVE
jgi:hypothetical protein